MEIGSRIMLIGDMNGRVGSKDIADVGKGRGWGA